MKYKVKVIKTIEFYIDSDSSKEAMETVYSGLNLLGFKEYTNITQHSEEIVEILESSLVEDLKVEEKDNFLNWNPDLLNK